MRDFPPVPDHSVTKPRIGSPQGRAARAFALVIAASAASIAYASLVIPS